MAVAQEWRSGGAGAARRLRGSGAAAAQEGVRSIQVKGRLVGLGLHSACGAAEEA